MLQFKKNGNGSELMVHVFLLMGQSNMAGRGFLSEVPPIIHDKIKVLKNGRWQRMWEPIHADRRFAGIGPAASFAMQWVEEHPGEDIGLVPTAEGGSAISEWLPGEPLFEHAVMEADFASRIGVIEGILWHQGETDTEEQSLPLFYNKLCLVREEFCKRTGLKEIPFIIGELGEYLKDCEIFPAFRNYRQINEKLTEYVKNHENTYLVTAKGLTSNSDIIHFDAVSQRLFGMRYYAAYKRKTDVCEPLEEEQSIKEKLLEYRELSAKQKKEALMQMHEEGLLNWQELEFILSEM